MLGSLRPLRGQERLCGSQGVSSEQKEGARCQETCESSISSEQEGTTGGRRFKGNRIPFKTLLRINPAFRKKDQETLHLHLLPLRNPCSQMPTSQLEGWPCLLPPIGLSLTLSPTLSSSWPPPLQHRLQLLLRGRGLWQRALNASFHFHPALLQSHSSSVLLHE